MANSRRENPHETPYSCVLFDLDGTLLGLRMESFLKAYFGSLTRHMSGVLAPDQFPSHLQAATQAMLDPHPGLTNAEAFDQTFYPRAGVSREVCEPHFLAYYRDEFPKLAATAVSVPEMLPLLNRLAASGRELVLATNPLFPHEATAERMRWAGLSDIPWRLVTTYEDMHHCKPSPAYYQEVLARVERRPDECLMVGNDEVEDGAAERVGIDTFLLEGAFAIPEPDGRKVARYRGGFADLERLLFAGGEAGADVAGAAGAVDDAGNANEVSDWKRVE